jgi:hypothetical protein
MAAVAEKPQLVYRPQPKQEAWHQCPAYESGFGGAKFGGKSLGLLMEATRYSHHPRYRGVIFRRDFPRLSELLDRAWQWLPGLGATWKGDEHVWTFPSGGRLLLRHCQHEESKFAYQGHEYQFMGFDQLEEFSESQYTYLLMQNRSGVAELEPYTRSTFNPGGIGHAWVRQRFVNHGTFDCEPWTVLDDRGKGITNGAGVPVDRCFHFAKIDDNPAGEAADPGYRARLQMLPDHERRAMLDGDWDVFAGQYFPEWRRDIHVCRPFAIPREWLRWRAVDFGHFAPMCCLWLARSPEGQVFVYRELYETGLRDTEQAMTIQGLSGNERIAVSYGDPSMWNTQPNGTSIAQAYQAGGVYLVPANNDRLAGWQRVHQALSEEPVLQVFDTCVNLIRTLPAQVHDLHRVEDLNTEGEDHAVDALRYGLMGGHKLRPQAATTTSYGYGR